MFKKFFISIAALSMFSIVTTISYAGNILYYVDQVEGSDQMLSALDYYAVSGDHTYTKLIDVNLYASEIGTPGKYDLGIIMIQNNNSSDYASAINALGTFVEKGGLSIYTDWSRNDSLAGLFDVSWTHPTS